MTMTKKFLPFHLPEIGREEKKEVMNCLDSGWLTMGPRVKDFEEAFRAHSGARHAIAVSSCTAALHLSLVALGVKPGDEVLTTPYTFAATANAIIHCGARPVFVDIDRETYNIDPARLEEKITRRTKGILVVHFGGHPCDMDAINAIARRRKLFVVEDAAHALGARYRGRKVGTLGDAGCFSFYATKNITTGEGGMITTRSAAAAEKMRVYLLHGINKDAWKRYSRQGSWKYDVIFPGFKYNMADIQAAMGVPQLKKLPAMAAACKKHVAFYNAAFAGCPELTLPTVKPWAEPSWHLYPVLLGLEKLKIGRDEFIEKMKQAGIGCSVHFIPFHRHSFYRRAYGLKAKDYPNCEYVYSRTVSLPLYSRMKKSDAARVAAAVKAIIAGNRR